MKVPLLDLTVQYQPLKAEIEAAVHKVMDNQTFILGPAVAAFEEHIAKYSRCRHAVGVSSGTDALLCSLMALDIGPGDEVIVPVFTFFGSAGAIARTGAKPVFVDIDPDTFNIDIHQIENAITPQTRAIMPVHLFGQMARMDAILEIAGRHGLAVIEDACQAIGSSQNSQMTGERSTCSCLSFYPSKNLAAFGDGGLILCQDDTFDQTCRYLRMHGESKRYYHNKIGGNFRLDALQAVVLDIKLKYLDGWVAKRRKNAALYNEWLSPAVQKPTIDTGNTSVYNQYVIRCPRRDDVQRFLTEKGIGSAIYYPVPLHLQECFGYLGGQPGQFPVAEQACREVLALPIYPELSQEQIGFVAESINEFYKGNR